MAVAGMSRNLLVSTILLMVAAVLMTHARIDLTKIQCMLRSKGLAQFEFCDLKVVNRSYKYIKIKVNIFKLPLSNVGMNFVLMRKSNTYKPYILNVTVDGCAYLKNPYNSPMVFFWEIFSKHSNLNHSCPIVEDIIVDGMDASLIDRLARNFGLITNGEYAVYTKWFAAKKLIADVRIFATVDLK